jgi:hypothetical protein
MVRLDGLRFDLPLRRIGLAQTQFVQATCATIRLKLLKIGALVKGEYTADQIRHGLRLPLAK